MNDEKLNPDVIKNSPPEPILYILMRNDLDSMVPGKAVAQGSHATNLFENSIDSYDEQFKRWKGGLGFGTCLVMGVNINQLREFVRDVEDFDLGISGIVTDPTYPVKDGDMTHLVSIETCGFVFPYEYHHSKIKNKFKGLGIGLY